MDLVFRAAQAPARMVSLNRSLRHGREIYSLTLAIGVFRRTIPTKCELRKAGPIVSSGSEPKARALWFTQLQADAFTEQSDTCFNYF